MKDLPTKRIKVNPIIHGKDLTTNKCCSTDLPVAAATTRIISELSEKLSAALYNNNETVGIEGELISAEALELVNGLKSGYGVTAGWNTPDTLALQMMEYNLFEFSASKNEARLAAMHDLLVDQDKNEIRSEADFIRLANDRVKDLNQNYLSTEYNLSVAVGQNSAAYLRFMSEKDTVTSFVQYQTAGDSKVRNEHEKLDGRIFNLSDREAMKLFPPNGHGCRCEFVQYNRTPKAGEVISGKTAQEMLNSENANWSKSQFNVNRADLKQVFTNKQFYSDIKGLPKKLNDMTFDKYGLKEWKEFKSSLNSIILDKSITADNVSELFKNEAGKNFMGMSDYYGRKTIITKSTFDSHTKGKYVTKEENRHQLFPHIKQLLGNPDEVWYQTPNRVEGKFQSRYIKFFKDVVLVADCDLTSKGLEVKTWYSGKASDLRKGLLVKKGKDS